MSRSSEMTAVLSSDSLPKLWYFRISALWVCRSGYADICAKFSKSSGMMSSRIPYRSSLGRPRKLPWL